MYLGSEHAIEKVVGRRRNTIQRRLIWRGNLCLSAMSCNQCQVLSSILRYWFDPLKTRWNRRSYPLLQTNSLTPTQIFWSTQTLSQCLKINKTILRSTTSSPQRNFSGSLRLTNSFWSCLNALQNRQHYRIDWTLWKGILKRRYFIHKRTFEIWSDYVEIKTVISFIFYFLWSSSSR